MPSHPARVAISLVQRRVICSPSHRRCPRSPQQQLPSEQAGWLPSQRIPFGAAANLTTRSAPQRTGRTGRFYPTDTGDPSRTVGPHPCEPPVKRWKRKPSRQDASGLQSCSDKSRGNLFLFQGNYTRDNLPR